MISLLVLDVRGENGREHSGARVRVQILLYYGEVNHQLLTIGGDEIPAETARIVP
jgi:hypothetical protein